MKKLTIPILILIVAVVAGGIYYATARPSGDIVLNGIVTTDEVIVSPEIQGRLQQLLVQEGDAVTKGELLAVIQPQEQLADLAYYASSQQQYADQVTQAEADLEFARLTCERDESLFKQHAVSTQDNDQARTSYDAAKARVESLKKQAEAAAAQREKATVQLGYTRIFAPVAGIVDTRVALQGEVVNPGEPIVTLIDPDDLWVRADVEETYIDRIRVGEKLKVTLPSGAVREGTVFYRGVDADYATQRDVSRTKRDIRTFEIRLRCDNRDRALAVGMTAYVALPLNNP
ncbi:MAG TPA: efflux RND transporter periplasmic adaptor subunit [Tepidisphaeraceae bacterium]|jgi:HlyD family secretion protein|nr:efflux RND transporter periplasmic adaptor subunit [Tepidisphaeraceae bacterium]